MSGNSSKSDTRKTTEVVRVGRVDLEHLKLFAREAGLGSDGEVSPREAVHFARHAMSHDAHERLATTFEARSIARQIATVARLSPTVRFLHDDSDDHWWAISEDRKPFVIGVCPPGPVGEWLAKWGTALAGNGETFVRAAEASE